MIAQNIVDYLVATYQPDAIILHGSHARGDHLDNSDYDLILVGDFLHPPHPENYQGHQLDLEALLPTQPGHFSGKAPTWPLALIYDNPKKHGGALIERNRALYEKGPDSLTQQEILNRKNMLRRLFAKMTGRSDQTQLRMLYATEIYERCLRYYFEMRNRWPCSPPLASKLIQQEDQAFYTQLDSLFTARPDEATQNLFQMLFSEPL